MSEKITKKNVSSPGNKKTKILLVEDNLVNQEVALKMLLSCGHVVNIANNGEEAIRALGKEDYDVILMDVQMPVMNGYEATLRIREIEEETKTHIQIIGLTANTKNSDREKCFSVGMDDYLTKPVHIKDLINAIEEACRKKEKESQLELKDSNNEKASVDLETLVDKLGGNHELIIHCLEIFKADAPKLLKTVRNGLENENGKESKNSCHGLRGMLLTLEMHKAAAIASAMETLILEKNFETCQALLLSLENEINAAVNFIEILIHPDNNLKSFA